MSAPKGPARSNSQPPHTSADDRRDDLWKTRPSTEVTADRGENERWARARKIAENTPRKRSSRQRRHRASPRGAARLAGHEHVLKAEVDAERVVVDG